MQELCQIILFTNVEAYKLLILPVLRTD